MKRLMIILMIVFFTGCCGLFPIPDEWSKPVPENPTPIYSRPDKISHYSIGGSDYVTHTYYCVAGKYRVHTFEKWYHIWGYGEWALISVFKSNCIR